MHCNYLIISNMYFWPDFPRHAGYSLKLLIICLLQYITYLKRLHGYVLTSAIADLPLVRLLTISGLSCH
jgi:hypothetical protein